MPRNNTSGRRPQVVVFVTLLALLSVVAAPSAVAARRADPVTPDPAPTTTVPPTTEAPTTTLPTEPPTTLVPVTTTSTPRKGTSTTSSSTTTTLPEPPQDPNFVPAPLVPSANTDPLFHIARLVDADYVALDQATKALAPVRRQHQLAFERARLAAAVLNDAWRRDVAEARLADRSAADLKGAAMRAYAGYQGGENVVYTASAMANPSANGTERTYMALTTRQLKARASVAQERHRRALAVLDRAFREHQVAAATSRRAATGLAAANASLQQVKRQLDIDTRALMAAVELDPDLAPGTLTKLPKDVKAKAGVTLIDSPAGTIVLPAKADKRTIVAIAYVIRQYGKPYLWGGTGPDRFDCSGLMMRAFQAAGVASIPRVSQAQQAWAQPIDAKHAQPGDLVFFGRPAYHVGMYIGGGLMLNAPYTGSVVRVDRVWPDTFSGFGRVIWP